MSWWDDGTEILGDGPANQITAAWRRVFLPRGASGLPNPTVREALAAWAASLRSAPVAPAFARLLLQRDGAPELVFTGLDDAPADLRASFDQAMIDITAEYRQAFARPPTPMELTKTLSFVVRPNAADFFLDAAEILGRGSLRLRAEPVPGPARRALVFVLVGVSAREAERLIEAALGEGGQVIERLSHRNAPTAAAEVTARLPALEAQAEALTLHETMQTGSEAPSTIVHHRVRIPPRLGIAQLALLAQRTGGWVLGAELGSAPRFIVFHLGQTIEHRNVPDEASALAALSAAYRAITGGSPDELEGLWCAEPRTMIAVAPAPSFAPAPPPLRLAVIHADLAEVSRVAPTLAETPDSLRLLERQSPMSGLGFTLVRGPFSDAWAAALGSALSTSVSAIDFAERGGEARWIELMPGKAMTTGRCRGAIAVAELWARLMIGYGDAPAVLTWPPESG
ncbi:MAG: hypothetical protein U0359_20605 [Byssovorax sp.]